MNYIFLIVGILILFIIINTYLDKLKRKYLKQGYESGEKAVLKNMVHNSYWLNKQTPFYNFLQYYAAKYRKYGRVSSDTLRNDLVVLNTQKRITDLNDDELKSLI